MINRISIWLGSFSAVFIAIAAIFARGKRAGKQQTEAKHNEKTLESIKEAQTIINRVSAMSDDERKRLREKWNRD